MTWRDSSYMARRGVAAGRSGTRHRLTEADQGRYHYVYGPYADPVLRVQPGDTVEIETIDAFGGAIRTEADLPTQVLNFPYVNPQNGPIAVTLAGTTWQGAGLDAETRNGPISLTVPDGYNARLETGTVHGPFASDLPLTVTLQGRLSGPFTATLGSGGAPIRLVTTNGPVSIKRR